VWIDSDSVSRRHARIVVEGDAATLEDLGSKNGTYLSGEKINEAKAVSDGNEIRVGSASMVIRMLSETDTTRTER
jgi:pSer/pThr/pTyr-binding forkhead associated (FHA) protein